MHDVAIQFPNRQVLGFYPFEASIMIKEISFDSNVEVQQHVTVARAMKAGNMPCNPLRPFPGSKECKAEQEGIKGIIIVNGASCRLQWSLLNLPRPGYRRFQQCFSAVQGQCLCSMQGR